MAFDSLSGCHQFLLGNTVIIYTREFKVNGLMEDEENQVGEHLFSLPEAGETGRKNQFFFTRQSSRPGMREIFFSILSLSMFPSETVSARGNAFQ